MRSFRAGTLLVALVTFLFFSCNFEDSSEEGTEECPCDECIYGKPNIIKPKNTDMSFKVDVSETGYFQPFQYDLKHSFGILGRLGEVEKDSIKRASFSILEVAECDRYKIESVKWEKMTAKDSVGYQHLIIFDIEKETPTEKNRIITINPDVTFKKGDIAHVLIRSKSDPRIALPKAGEGNHYTYAFPPFYCPIKLINTSD